MIGETVAHYRITAKLGEGGMGAVYRATDTKLKREVALKVLPDAFAGDPERMARFQREAELLASLNHPNIAHIYGVEERALVMELVEGPTLASPLALEAALDYARQIAEALEYAHEKGIIHRDLKPANVKVTGDGVVKLLDFGLAKAVEDPLHPGDDPSNSPTLTLGATRVGVILGTAAYMSPEQASAKAADRRADIWSFGAVLYEMLAGKKAFEGESVSDTLASVLKLDPDWNALPKETPASVSKLVRRCLTKDRKQRLQAIGEARISLDEVRSGVPESASSAGAAPPIRALNKRPALFLGAAALLAAAITGAAVWVWKPAPVAAPAEPVRFQIAPPKDATFAGTGWLAVSPDGRQLAFSARGADGMQRLWIRALDSLEARPLPGSEMPVLAIPFFWSPDSRFIAFYADGKLKKIDASSGIVETLCDLPQEIALGGTWNRDGAIVFGQAFGGLMRVSAAGGSASPLTTVDRSRGEFHHIFPTFLPDKRHFIYQRATLGGTSGIYLGSLDAKPAEQDSKPLVANASTPEYVPSSDPDSGHLLFVRDGALLSQSLDARRLALTGAPAVVVNRIGTFRDVGYFSASHTGVLVYWTGRGANSQLRWFDRQGKTIGAPLEVGPEILGLSVSPRGTAAAVWRAAPGSNLWLVDLSRRTSTRFASDLGSTTGMVWSPDSSRIIFAANRDGSLKLYQKPANGIGAEQPLLKSGENGIPSSWSRDGRFLLYTVQDRNGKDGIWVLPLEGDRKPFPFLRTDSNEDEGQLSPDGHWAAYRSDASGRDEIYVQTFAPNPAGASSDTGTRVLISTGGGTDPRWRGDGKELYYISADGMLMAVDIATSSKFQPGLPKALFRVPPSGRSDTSWGPTPDGTRFLFPAPPEEDNTPFTVVLNWETAIRK